MNYLQKMKYKRELNKAMSFNRHDRRALAKINGITKIPSKNVPITNNKNNK